MTIRKFDQARVGRALNEALARAESQEKQEGVKKLDLFNDQYIIFSDLAIVSFTLGLYFIVQDPNG